jgi:hypothetical protein
LVHAVVDNYATHKHPKLKAWLEPHPRWTFHFTPTSGSWLNAVETFFSALTRKGSGAAAWTIDKTGLIQYFGEARRLCPGAADRRWFGDFFAYQADLDRGS